MSDTTTLDVLVKARRNEALDICSFELVDGAGAALPAFTAGSHLDVHLPNGLTRQYSLCNDPAENHRYLIAVLREPASRGGSQAMHDAVQVGTRLRISAPKNHFELAGAAEHSLLLAGGIGVTPILAMARRLARTGASFEMHYSVRSRERAAFADEIAASAFTQNVSLHLDDGAPEQKLDLERLLAASVAGRHLYVCGPKGFMDAVLGTARRCGWPEERLHWEFFAADVLKSDTDAVFSVKVASSGQVVEVRPGQTIVEALAAAGVSVETSCEQGVCGTCLTRVLEGVPDHRDSYLMPDEQSRNDQMLVCCSRSRSPLLVLDL
ncbi:MAG: oxidoreductase [Burkholderiales bacterium]|nr:oxidoreductase [Burkholderiales bacterium]